MWSNANSKYCTNSKLWSGMLEKISTDDKIIAIENVNTMSTVDAVLKLCWHQNLEILHCADTVLTLCWYSVEKFGVCTIYEFAFYHYSLKDCAYVKLYRHI